MHTIASLYIFLSVYAPFLNISNDSKLRGGFDLPTRIPVGSFTIESIYLAMDAKSPSDVKLFVGIYMDYKVGRKTPGRNA